MNNPSVQVANALEVRLFELEKVASRKRGLAPWDFVFSIIPRWLAVLAVGGFIGFQAWGYYSAAQQVAAKTKISGAEAALKRAQAIAENTKADGDTIRFQIARAELDQNQAEATIAGIKATAISAPANKAGSGGSLALAQLRADVDKAQGDAQRARIEADALNTRIGETTVLVETAKAELAIKQKQAEKARLAAEAALHSSGLLTLQQRAERANYAIAELKVVQSRVDARQHALMPWWVSNISLDAPLTLMAELMTAYCIDNPYAELIDCPPRLITRHPPKITITNPPSEQPPKTVTARSLPPSTSGRQNDRRLRQ